MDLLLRDVLDQVSACVGVLAPDGVLVEINEGPLREFGICSTDVLGRCAWDLPWWVEPSRIRDGVTRAARGERVRFDAAARIGDGPPLVLDVQIAPRLDGRGNAEYLVVTAVDVSDRCRAEEALRWSEARFRAAQDLSVDGFTILHAVRDATGGIVDFEWTYANDAAASILKRRADALVGHRLLAVLPGNRSHSDLFARYVRVVETGEAHDVELYYEADEIAGWFRNAAIKLDDGVAVSFHDITERKSIEARLEVAKQAAGVATWDWNLATGVARISASYRQLWGMAPDAPDPAYGDWLSHIHPDDRARADDEVRRALEGAPYETEFRIVRPDGEVRWLSARGRVERGQDGRPVRMIGANVDVTARKEAEEAVRESEERLRLAAEAGSLVAWDYDIAAGRNYWGPRFSDLLGIPPSDISAAQQDWPNVIHPDDRPRVVAAFRAAVEGRAPFDAEFRVVRTDDGAVRWFASKARLLRNDDGTPRRMVGFVQDVTERKAAESRLRELAEEREVLLKEAHHRIKNHVMMVGTMLELQARDQRSDEARAQLLDASRRVSAIGHVHEALYLSDRLGAVELGPHLRRVMEEIASSAVTPSGRPPGIHVACPADVRLPAEVAAPLSLIAVELVTNAIKHAGVEGEPVIDIDVAAGDVMRLVVTDNGQGLLADDEPQAPGFGFTLIHSLARQIDGTLSFESIPQGTRATLSLPWHRDART